MKLREDSLTENWLEHVWEGDFDWDENNIYKLSKHLLDVELVESLFQSENVFAGEIVNTSSTPWNERRWLSVGHVQQEKFQRIVTLVWTKRENLLRCITARSAWPKEKKLYEQHCG